MNCIIIEDEAHTADYLEYQLKLTGYDVDVLMRMDRVETAVTWLKQHHTDLIFLDVELGDGLGFEIFDQVQVKTPVIFTTSYNQYAIKAFDLNSIAYLLKPIKQENLKQALDKYNSLYDETQTINEKILPLHQSLQKRFLVQSGSSYKSIPVEEVAYFQVQKRRYLTLITKDKQQYIFDSTLEILEQRLDPEKFFRINRQFIISFDSIASMDSYERGRLKINTIPTCKEEMIVSIDKAASFRNWLNR